MELERKAFEVDVCHRCHFLWFDGGEFEALPRQSQPSPPKELPAKAKEALALWEVERIREGAIEGEGLLDGPENGWQVVAGVLGMPVEHGQEPLRRLPVITWTVAALMVLASVAGFFMSRELFVELAFVPKNAWHYFGLTSITSFFLHGGIWHLLGNLYFLLVFGDNVEDLIGRKRFLIVLALSALVGDLSHWAMEPRGELPSVGASGGISGIIALYSLAFPHAKLGVLMRISFYFRWVRFSAGTGFLLWLVLQVFGAWMQVSGESNVSSLAHLGGCLVGICYWFIFGRKIS
jgi:membrane associated rhomboid family serine protease